MTLNIRYFVLISIIFHGLFLFLALILFIFIPKPILPPRSIMHVKLVPKIPIANKTRLVEHPKKNQLQLKQSTPKKITKTVPQKITKPTPKKPAKKTINLSLSPKRSPQQKTLTLSPTKKKAPNLLNTLNKQINALHTQAQQLHAQKQAIHKKQLNQQIKQLHKQNQLSNLNKKIDSLSTIEPVKTLEEALPIDVVERVRKKIESCWIIPPGAPKNGVTRILAVIDRRAVVIKTFILSYTPNNNYGKSLSEGAERSLLSSSCNPLPLPKSMYTLWHKLIFNFSPSTAS